MLNLAGGYPGARSPFYRAVLRRAAPVLAEEGGPLTLGEEDGQLRVLLRLGADGAAGWTLVSEEHPLLGPGALVRLFVPRPTRRAARGLAGERPQPRGSRRLRGRGAGRMRWAPGPRSDGGLLHSAFFPAVALRRPRRRDVARRDRQPPRLGRRASGVRRRAPARGSRRRRPPGTPTTRPPATSQRPPTSPPRPRASGDRRAGSPGPTTSPRSRWPSARSGRPPARRGREFPARGGTPRASSSSTRTTRRPSTSSTTPWPWPRTATGSSCGPGRTGRPSSSTGRSRSSATATSRSIILEPVGRRGAGRRGLGLVDHRPDDPAGPGGQRRGRLLGDRRPRRRRDDRALPPDVAPGRDRLGRRPRLARGPPRLLR